VAKGSAFDVEVDEEIGSVEIPHLLTLNPVAHRQSELLAANGDFLDQVFEDAEDRISFRVDVPHFASRYPPEDLSPDLGLLEADGPSHESNGG